MAKYYDVGEVEKVSPNVPNTSRKYSENLKKNLMISSVDRPHKESAKENIMEKIKLSGSLLDRGTGLLQSKIPRYIFF